MTLLLKIIKYIEKFSDLSCFLIIYQETDIQFLFSSMMWFNMFLCKIVIDLDEA